MEPDAPFFFELLVNIILYLPGIAILVEVFLIFAIIADENASSMVIKGNFAIILSPIFANILLAILYNL